MANDGGATPEAEARAEFEMEFMPRLPHGRAIIPAEREGKFVFLVAIGAMTQQCFDEMVRHLQAIVGGGSWSQNWREPTAEQDPAPTHRDESLFDMEWRDTLPDGATILPDEQKGRFVWLVRRGAMTKQCFDEMRAYLVHIVSSGQWSQNWGTAPQPGH